MSIILIIRITIIAKQHHNIHYQNDHDNASDNVNHHHNRDHDHKRKHNHRHAHNPYNNN